MFARLRRFFKRIGAAIKELFTGKNDEAVTTTTTETEYDEDGNIKAVKVEVVEDPNHITWRGLFKKAGRKIKESVNEMLENPAKLMKAIGIGGIGGWSLISMIRSFKEADNMIFGPMRRRKAKREEECRIYDDRTHLWYHLRRPLTNAEKNYIAMQQRVGGNMGDILARWRVLA